MDGYEEKKGEVARGLPMSVPTPRGLPPMARADSPPELLPVPRAHGPPKDVVDRLADHHGRRHVCLDVQDGAGGLEQLGKGRVGLGGVADVRGEAEGGVEPAHLEAVLERDGQAVQGADGPARAGQVLVAGPGRGDGAVKARLRESVCLRGHRRPVSPRGTSLSSGGGKGGSPRLASWCAAAARLQKAATTASDRSSPEASRGTSSDAVRPVTAASSAVSQPDVRGQSTTLRCDPGGSRPAGTRHRDGIDAASAALFLAPMSSHGSSCGLSGAAMGDGFGDEAGSRARLRAPCCQTSKSRLSFLGSA